MLLKFVLPKFCCFENLQNDSKSCFDTFFCHSLAKTSLLKYFQETSQSFRFSPYTYLMKNVKNSLAKKDHKCCMAKFFAKYALT
jgi:hypothetical protein